MARRRRHEDGERSAEDWAELSERARLLAVASLHSVDDHYATRDLIEILKPRVINLARNVARSDRESVMNRLFHIGLTVLKEHAAQDRVDDILAYTFTAMRHEFGRAIEELGRGFPLAATGREAEDDIAPQAEVPFDDALARVALASFRDAMACSNRKIDALVAEVVITTYMLGGSLRGNCRILGLTERQTDRVCEEISKQRGDEASPLRRFGDALFPGRRRPGHSPDSDAEREG